VPTFLHGRLRLTLHKTPETESAHAWMANRCGDPRLANVRYQGGVTSYLEVLDSDTRNFEAEILLAQAELNERLALVQIYNALGGGWQQ